jgi:hypothetical protein
MTKPKERNWMNNKFALPNNITLSQLEDLSKSLGLPPTELLGLSGACQTSSELDTRISVVLNDHPEVKSAADFAKTFITHIDELKELSK